MEWGTHIIEFKPADSLISEVLEKRGSYSPAVRWRLARSIRHKVNLEMVRLDREQGDRTYSYNIAVRKLESHLDAPCTRSSPWYALVGR